MRVMILLLAQALYLQALRISVAPRMGPQNGGFATGFDTGQMPELVERGQLEAAIMEANSAAPLHAPIVPSPSGRRGFGVAKGNRRAAAKRKGGNAKVPQPESIATLSHRTLEEEGVVRVNGVLSASTAALLRADVIARRDAAYEAIANGADWRATFADVLLKTKRCDLLLPLKGSRSVQLALRELLCDAEADRGGKATPSTLYSVLSAALGEDATLYELASLVSEPGSPRQPVHPDTPHQKQTPLLTCFIALQDVDESMGATIFLPGTHTADAHAHFEHDVAARDALLAKRLSTVALLKAGDASLFDSRTLHCGGLNDGALGATRALFYVSFQNPRIALPVGNVGSILPAVKQKSYTLRKLYKKLSATLCHEDNMSFDQGFDPFDESREETETVRALRAAAELGQSDAQFNLGVCYRRGEGVEKDDASAVQWFRRAAEQGEALAQTNLGFAFYLGEGVEKNETEAARWFGLAAAGGEPNARHNLGICFSQGVGVHCDPLYALELFSQAAAQGHQGAQGAYDDLKRQLESAE